eukprot:CAMPEP_0173391618 /NCGR_PEP_ID=MMETSP1356-20130122/18489_1 /TAXON_ID=77927 ORGANISM="Hemiselmis virescens, Strain PCC157" /NCGR_SAMPLE_ID=MMETSP1356 /ASSEMBLY_ACC=CAM_ASM_000847 /LENGTH=370 /DNA_ID=CAMNT_0014349277 /DNA_START=8 /DNA_END=1120 /DNA_ORIENTATION=-
MAVLKVALVGGAALLCMLAAVVSLRGAARSVLLEVARRQQLGEDKDWNVKSWSAHHRTDVALGRMDAATTRNIWSGKQGEAWKGIDDILPTGGRYAYEEDHQHNAKDAKMLLFLKAAEGKVAAMEKAVPTKGVSKNDAKLVKKTMAVLEHDARALKAFEMRVRYPPKASHHASNSDEAAPQMLSQATLAAAHGSKHQEGRVFEDDALYGEGIQGDIKSQGHHEAAWNAASSQKDMNRYFSSLSAADTAHLAEAHARSGVLPWGGNDKGLHGYWASLAQRGAAQEGMHQDILRRDGYYEQHPFESSDLHAYVRGSWGHPVGAAAGGMVKGAVAGAKGGVEMEKRWEALHGVPKTPAQLAAFADFAASGGKK